MFIKISDTSGLVTTTALNTKISEVKDRVPDHSKYITTQELNKLTAENVAARLTQANLVNKTDFDNKLIRFNRKYTSSKTKYLKVLGKLNSLPAKDYDLISDRMYFTSNGGSQNTFVSQPTIDN